MLRLVLATGLLTACRPSDVTIRAGLLLDGRGGQQRDVAIVVRDGHITRVGPWSGGQPTYDLSLFTVLPGLIDGHVHIASYFNRFGKPSDDSVTPAERAALLADNALVTLQAGFTTVASLGAGADRQLRDRIASGAIPGPRVLTSTGQLHGGAETPDSLQRLVHSFKSRGADFVKIIASSALRDGGKPLLSLDQLAAICDEAARLGLRSVVHAHDDPSMTLAAQAKCGRVEHGFTGTARGREVLAAATVAYGPQCGIVLRNYLNHRGNYEGLPGFDAAEFRRLEEFLPKLPVILREALATPGLTVLYGTDATAGAHGHNAEDLVCRVREAGDTPMNALISATSRNAAALGLGEVIGTVAPGFAADLIALDGDPLLDIEAVLRVRFVMRAGTVYVKP